MDEIKYPYNDDYMFFDDTTKRYILTEKDILENLGVDISARINGRNAINPQAMIARFLKHVSDDVYNFIHKHNINTELQDKFIAKIPTIRNIIKEAMEEQALLMLTVGDLSKSTDKDKRAVAIDDNCMDILGQIVPELGTSILYSGTWRGYYGLS